tara:strand:- start:203 stop:364 length:162 start_codon:yes stop_codon:yes gene_type:complete
MYFSHTDSNTVECKLSALDGVFYIVADSCDPLLEQLAKRTGRKLLTFEDSIAQ